MKSRLFKRLSVPLSLGILLTGCSYDDVPAESEKPVDKDTDFYMNVRIATPAEDDTRADDTNTNTAVSDYVNGTSEEQKIHKILFVFYNSDYEYVGNATYTPDSETPAETAPGSIETVLNLTVPVTVAAGSTKPAYVMAYVNPTNRAENDLFTDYYSALGAFRTLDDVREIKSGTNAHAGFAMNNSVHYEEGKENELPRIAVPINPETQLFTTVKKAEEAGPESAVVIYVERIVAKVTLKEQPDWEEENNTISDEAGNEYTLNFNILGWGLSNLEKYTFLVKNFRTSGESDERIEANPSSFTDLMEFTNYTYGTLNTRLTDGGLTNPNWNFPDNNTSTAGGNWGISGHRTFWALSPTYYDGHVKIPHYADDIYYYDSGKDYPTVHQDLSSLIYRSFNNIYNTKANPAAIGQYGKLIGETAYTLEHTMQASLVTNYQKRAVTCAVVVGKYKIMKGRSEVNFDHFYIRKKMTENGHVSVIYTSENEMKTAYLNANSIIHIKTDDGKYVTVPASDNYLGDFIIDHPRKDITGETSVASRYVTIRLANPAAGKYYRQDSNGNWEAITAENLHMVNEDLYANMIGMLGGIEMYYNGYAYFEVPIRHLWARDNKNIGEKDFKAKLGQYGIVRNHSYNVSVKGIDGIGIGISDPDAPIVPNVENDDYVVKTEIRVQRWRVVPAQEVTLRQ